jgi:hypothetical protein
MNRCRWVPSRVMGRDRTYASPVALRNWFREHNMPGHSIDVITEDLHECRTRLLFQKAFGKEVQVGIIAVPHPDYPPNRWWLYNEGVKDVVSECAAYVYARLLFLPPLSARPSGVAKVNLMNRGTTPKRGAQNPANLTRTIKSVCV